MPRSLTWLVLAAAALATAAMSRPERPWAQSWEIAAPVLALIVCIRLRHRARAGWTSSCLLAAAAWGGVQWFAGWTLSPERTAAAIAQWVALGALAFVAENVFTDTVNRNRFLRGAAVAGGVTAILCLAQPYALGIAYDAMAGPFQNRNTYCSFVELLLPVVAWRAGKEPSAEWAWWMAAAGMVASAIATGSRAGSALVIVEFALLLLLARQRRALIVGGTLVAVWVAAAGWETLGWRVWQTDPMQYRWEMIASAARMAAEHPWAGIGVGAFIDAYPPFATFDVGRIVNHAHSDWVEWAAEGGIGFALLLAAPFFAAARKAKLWTAGTFFVLIHSLIDYPMQRAGMAVWVWLILAAATAPTDSTKRRAAPRKKLRSRAPVRSSDRSLATAER